MKADPLDALLEKLSGGDNQAAQQVFVALEPYLHMVVRRQLPNYLRAKFDSTDIVQSIWTDMIEGFQGTDWRFPDANHLRAFLVKVARNRMIDQTRKYRYYVVQAVFCIASGKCMRRRWG